MLKNFPIALLILMAVLVLILRRTSANQDNFAVEVASVQQNNGGDAYVIEIECRNLSASDVQITAVQKSCNCLSVEALPIVVAANSTKLVCVNVDGTKTLPQNLSFVFYTEPPYEHKALSVKIW